MSLVFLSCETVRVGVRIVNSRLPSAPEVSIKDAGFPYSSHFSISLHL